MLILKKIIVTKNPYSCAEWGNREAPKVALYHLRAVCESMGSFLRAAFYWRAEGTQMSTSLSPNAHGTEPTSFQSLKDATDEQLIDGIKRLRVCHFNELVSRYTRYFCYVARMEMNKPYEEPEAIVNTAFFSIWTSAKNSSLDRISTRSQFFTMMRFRIRNTIIDIVEYFSAMKRDYLSRRVRFNPSLCTSEDIRESSENAGRWGKIVETVRCQLNDSLGKNHGEIFWLRMQRMPFMEISKKTQIAETTVRDRLKKARTWLIENSDQLQSLVSLN